MRYNKKVHIFCVLLIHLSVHHTYVYLYLHHFYPIFLISVINLFASMVLGSCGSRILVGICGRLFCLGSRWIFMCEAWRGLGLFYEGFGDGYACEYLLEFRNLIGCLVLLIAYRRLNEDKAGKCCNKQAKIYDVSFQFYVSTFYEELAVHRDWYHHWWSMVT